MTKKFEFTDDCKRRWVIFDTESGDICIHVFGQAQPMPGAAVSMGPETASNLADALEDLLCKTKKK